MWPLTNGSGGSEGIRTKLRLAGLVTVRREGTFAYYAAANTHVQRLLDEALSHVDHATHRVQGGAPHHDRADG